EHTLIMQRRLGALLLYMMRAGEQVTGVRAEHRLDERQHRQGLLGGGILPEQEAGEAGGITSLIAITALRENRVLEESRRQRLGVLGFLQAQKHFGVIAAGADGPFELNGQLFRARRGRRLGLERGLRDGKLRPRLLEALAGTV